MQPVQAVVILALTSTLAMAEVKTAQPVNQVFQALDRNADQLISRQEAAADRSLRDRFAAVDADGDGYVDKSELLARPDEQDFE